MEKLKQYIRFLFKSEDKRINEIKNKLISESIYTDDELNEGKKISQLVYNNMVTSNKLSMLIVEDVVKSLRKRFYGRE
jgi:hypothetical protein